MCSFSSAFLLLTRRVLPVAGLSLLLAAGSAATARAQDARATVAAAFQAWEKGTGSPFDLLAEGATWTILGPSRTAGTYTIPELQEQILTPFQARLAAPLRPNLRALYEDGDTVIALFEAQTTLKSGRPYSNSYAWFFRFEEGKVRNVTAVLDVSAFDAVLAEEAGPALPERK